MKLVPRALTRASLLAMVVVAVFPICNSSAFNLDAIGVTLLRLTTTNLDGSGILVGQPEGPLSPNPPAFEVNPAAGGVSQNPALFVYISDRETNTAFPNMAGVESGHADGVGGIFYGIPGGIATNVMHIDNYEANHFFNDVIQTLSPAYTNDQVVNQSFVFSPFTVSDELWIDSLYDDYAAHFGTLFVSGAGNGTPAGMPGVCPPSTCYNGIGVGVYGASSSVGPTIDNGRAKPDITAPENVTSFSTPQVAGAAALLMQAALRGDAGADTNSAADIRTIKAFLLNGAIKPPDWTNSSSTPLDLRYGAGNLNVFESYRQLAGGKQPNSVTTTIAVGNPHPPSAATNRIPTLSAWNFTGIDSDTNLDGVQDYYFDVTNGNRTAPFTATATLVWNRQEGQTNINNLDLFLYDAVSGNLVASSTSAVDNVEHLFVTSLPQGIYDLQVLKHGGSDIITGTEFYALAFEFFSVSLNITRSGTNAIVTWPVYPTGFVLQSTTNLAPPIVWSTNNPSPVVTNLQNQVLLDASTGDRFFRLIRP